MRFVVPIAVLLCFPASSLGASRLCLFALLAAGARATSVHEVPMKRGEKWTSGGAPDCRLLVDAPVAALGREGTVLVGSVGVALDRLGTTVVVGGTPYRLELPWSIAGIHGEERIHRVRWTPTEANPKRLPFVGFAVTGAEEAPTVDFAMVTVASDAPVDGDDALATLLAEFFRGSTVSRTPSRPRRLL